MPFLFATDTYPGSEPEGFDPRHYLKDVRDFVTRRLGDAALLGEVNLPYPQQKDFFGGADGDGLNMQFDFIGMQRLYLSLARGDAGPLAAALRERPALDVTSQWANFVRNHDELTLDKLSKTERQEVFDAFGPDPDMQLYDRGLRRRLPPMLGGDERRIRLVYSLMFSLPGTPTLFYGEEIGMGENLDVEGRLAVRTPMQWDDGPNGGFSTAPPRRLTRPQPDGLFWPEQVNARDAAPGPGLPLAFVRRLIRRYRQMPQIGWSPSRCSTATTRRCSPTSAAATGGACSPSTTSRADDAMVPSTWARWPRGRCCATSSTGARTGRSTAAAGWSCASTARGAWLRVLAPGEQAYA